jgi:hypothetical protein
MVRRAASWFWRDRSLIFPLLVWTAFGFSLLFYFNDWPAARHKPKPPQRHVMASQTNDDEIYTGSIITFPPTGNQCSELMMDNRTGKMWDNGFVNCDDVTFDISKDRLEGSFDVKRLRTISKIFRGEHN